MASRRKPHPRDREHENREPPRQPALLTRPVILTSQKPATPSAEKTDAQVGMQALAALDAEDQILHGTVASFEGEFLTENILKAVSSIPLIEDLTIIGLLGTLSTDYAVELLGASHPGLESSYNQLALSLALAGSNLGSLLTSPLAQVRFYLSAQERFLVLQMPFARGVCNLMLTRVLDEQGGSLAAVEQNLEQQQVAALAWMLCVCDVLLFESSSCLSLDLLSALESAALVRPSVPLPYPPPVSAPEGDSSAAVGAPLRLPGVVLACAKGVPAADRSRLETALQHQLRALHADLNACRVVPSCASLRQVISELPKVPHRGVASKDWARWTAHVWTESHSSSLLSDYFKICQKMSLFSL